MTGKGIWTNRYWDWISRVLDTLDGGNNPRRGKGEDWGLVSSATLSLRGGEDAGVSEEHPSLSLHTQVGKTQEGTVLDGRTSLGSRSRRRRLHKPDWARRTTSRDGLGQTTQIEGTVCLDFGSKDCRESQYVHCKTRNRLTEDVDSKRRLSPFFFLQ